MTAPSFAISPAQTHVFFALLRVYERDGRATVRTVAGEAGRNDATTYAHLTSLRDAELVTWKPLHLGTLRPLVAPVAVLDGAP